jgi:ATP synthase protein I
MDTPTEKDKNAPQKTKAYIRFSGLGLQMGAIIAVFTWLGTYLDDKQANKTPVWTIVLSLFGVFGAMYLVFKEVKKINKEQE